MRMLTAAAGLMMGIASQFPEGALRAGQPVALTSPADGDTWAADSRHNVSWTGNGEGEVTLEYTTDDGETWAPIETAAPNCGTYLWKVPGNLSQKCRVRIKTGSTGGSLSSGKFSIIPSQEVAGYEWTNVTEHADFAPRDGAGALTFKSRMWLIGGWNPRDKTFFPRICNNEVWNSRDGAEWTLVKPNSFIDSEFDPEADWEGRHVAGYVVYKDRMWIVGGDGNQGHHMFDVWNSLDGASWTNVCKGKPVPWGPRALHHTVVFNDRIWILGGQTTPPFVEVDEKFYRDIWNTSDGVNWEQVVPNEPYWSTRGMIAGSVVFNDRMWILGGGTYDTPNHPDRNFYNDVWSSGDGVDWTLHVDSAPWDPRQFHSVAVFDKRMWILTGYYKPRGELNDVWYSADGVNWYEVPDTPWSVRHAVSVFVHDGALWMTGGPTGRPADVWKLTRSTDAAGQ